MVAFWAELTPRQILFLQTLRREGWRLTVIAWDREGTGQGPSLPKHLVDEVVVISLPAPTWSLRLLARLPIYHARLLGQVRRLEQPSLWILTHYLLLPVAPFMRGKVLYDAAEMYAVDLGHYAGFLRRPATALLGWMELLMARALDGITTVDSLGGWLEARYRATNRPVQSLWNVPALNDDAVSRNGAAHRSVAGKRVAFAGGLMREKGIRVTLEAAAIVRRQVADAQFVFFGVLKDDARVIEGLIRELGVAEALEFVPPLPYPELQNRLAACDVGLALYQPILHYPLVSAGNARKIFAYMQAGIPVVAPDFGEIGDAVRQAECGVLVDTEDPEAVADAIVGLLTSPDRSRAMGERGRRAIEERFNWEIERSKLLSFVETIAAGSSVSTS